MPGLILLAPGETTEFPTGHGRIRFRKYGRDGREFIRAAVHVEEPSVDGESRVALATLRPDAYPYAGAWLAAVAEHAPAAADHRNPEAAPASVRLLAEMTRTHANGVPRHSDGSVSWSVPGASARVWPDGRVEVQRAGCVVLAVRLEGSGWDSARVAAVADAGLRLLCAPEARHMTRTSEPSGWAWSSLWAGRSFDGASEAVCSCGWRVMAASRLGARGAAAEHVRKAVAVAPC
ncbi:hypothetical protein OHS33_39135 (plasmid) [Streptomyces sp. NBC_00536]|uniref:hypothetical protein n=1 Tax=Streptomyces sp. NBC_00536 TaxID=2975769 RepID=UPI002E80B8DC|nr:hypothetical protein [Streptomyces sp. NBC_00536]WUC84374.1 hypothetical protein OHS33_39135 [Streptomyces sp. NBC_00536]